MNGLNLKKSFKVVLLLTAAFIQTSLFASTNLSKDFLNIYNNDSLLSVKEATKLKQFDIYLIPGILAETMVKGDKRTNIKFTLLLNDYYKTQLDVLNNTYKIPAKRLQTSSFDINVTKINIKNVVAQAAAKNRKVIFITHSLGGLVLLDELVSNAKIHKDIAGIAFLQSPFHGTELADLLLNPPFGLEKIIKKIIPTLNVSERTIQYVGIERQHFMKQNRDLIKSIVKNFPSYTVSSTVEANKSIFKPFIDLSESGCLKVLKDRCLTDVIYHGALDKTDGLIPYKSSFIEGADYVILKNVDHAELVLDTPYETFNRVQFTTTVLKMILKQMDK